ncbi:MAG: Gfo/Idh/MocA family oxidoreductase [Puniceicoccales bacterium]|jgi:predicted dehydrogenase|nr:Gfo/Idh/MocA family oxidoreductase [Puniceicoccales bacterium]
MSNTPIFSSPNAGLVGANSRRGFIGNCVALAGLPILASLPVNAFAAGTDEQLKVGLIGCGGRGRDAANDCRKAHPSVKIWALGDVFADVTERARKTLSKNERTNVPQERCFSGFDAFEKVIASGVDLVILATPPHFRPLHMEAAIKAGVHVFAEKPVAVDPAGCRKVIAVSELAEQKKLSIVAGTQRRHDKTYIETLKRIKEGAIGELVGGQAYWVGGTTDSFWPHHKRRSEWTEMEYQLRNWYAFTWLCGDHIVEQHVHNLDILNWAFGGPPVKAFGVGGRQNRTWGNIWDHFAVEFEYANGARISSYCRQTDNTSGRINERILGTLGSARPDRGIITGKNEWKYPGNRTNAYVQEHADLIESIRNRTPLNEGRALAEATLTGILGRFSAYTGKEVSYKWALEASKLDLTPSAYDFNAAPPPADIAIPGTTKLV